MNIFYLDKNPKLCAQYHVDRHVVKMILETAQLLSTAHWLTGGEGPYRATHKNHPSAIWARSNKSNYNWLCKLGLELCEEYTYRYGKVHLSIQKCLKALEVAPINMPTKLFEQPPQCMPDEYKDKCSVKAYWNYYIGEKHVVANPKTEKIWTKNLD